MPSDGRYYYPNRTGSITVNSTRNGFGPTQLGAMLPAASHERLLSTMPWGNFEKNFPFQALSDLQASTE